MKIVQGALLLAIGCLIGILAASLLGSVQYPLGSGHERLSPGDHIAEQSIQVYEDRVVISLDDARWATFADTNSMDPVFDAGNNAIQIVPSSPDQIQVGDIISFRSGGRVIIHRVVEKNIDQNGWYFITQGDNNNVPDPGKVRFEDVTRLTVAIIY
jgi:hypothetical protein